MATAKIKVHFGQLTKPLVAKNVNAETTLIAFCEANELTWDSSIRVNAKVQKQSYMLQEGDIITSIEDVDGGLV